jgi:5-hydroxyisourate hydrolase-like protein (transthyretin family)
MEKRTRRMTLGLLSVLTLAAIVAWGVLGGLHRPEATEPRERAPEAGREAGGPAPAPEVGVDGEGEPGAETAPESGPGGGSDGKLPLADLQVRAVDGETGRDVPGARIVLEHGGSGPPILCPRKEDHFRVPPGRRAGEWMSVTLRTVPPEGWAPERDVIRLQGHVSALTRTIRATMVLRPEVIVEVRVREHGGLPVSGAKIVEFRVAGTRIYVRSDTVTGDDGTVRLGQAPYLRHAWVTVAARSGERRQEASARIEPGQRRIRLEITFPPPEAVKETAEASGTVGIGGGGRGGRFGWQARSRDEPPDTRLETAVLRRDGTPAANAKVRLEALAADWTRTVRTDGVGRLVVRAFPPGPLRIELVEPGLLPATTTVDVKEGETARPELKEPHGLPLEILVRDRDGHPVPFAKVTVRAARRPFVLLDGDVQALTLHTDVDGRLRLPAVPAGEVEVGAEYAGRSGKVRGVAGGLLEVRLR